MIKLFKYLFHNVKKDNQFNYHKIGCRLRGHRFTVINNSGGLKISPYCIEYCPCCGERLR